MIREFAEGDAQALSALCRASIIHLGSLRYSPEQVRAWHDRAPSPEIYLKRIANGARIFVSETEAGAIAAYALLEPDGHLDRLFCHPDHARCGHASALLQHVDEEAQKLGIARLFTEASEVARQVFERAGYSVEHRRDFEMAGVPIHNYAMSKDLELGTGVKWQAPLLPCGEKAMIR